MDDLDYVVETREYSRKISCYETQLKVSQKQYGGFCSRPAAPSQGTAGRIEEPGGVEVDEQHKERGQAPDPHPQLAIQQAGSQA